MATYKSSDPHCRVTFGIYSMIEALFSLGLGCLFSASSELFTFALSIPQFSTDRLLFLRTR